MRPMKNADAKNDAALIANATFLPAIIVTMPPADAPSASIADHVALESALAGNSSSAVVRFGMIAVRAGSKKAAAVTVNAITAYAIHTWSPRRTRSSPRIRHPRTMSEAIISFRRSTRSTTTPASGATSAIGRICTIIIHATAVAEPVKSSSSANTATALNQSPSCEIAWPV